ncbi:STE3-like pheromone receptor [Mycena floridula]|nr:STE3-like pheromone receptor [Mycena floridula]
MVRSLDPTYPLFPICAFLGFILCLIPLPWHFQAWNSGTCAFMIWTSALCLVGFVNSIVWAGSVDNIAPIWCDISTQIILGAAVGIPASTLCITRRLYRITAIRTVSVTREDKRRAIMADLLIAVGLPVLVLGLHVIVHPHRFDIFEEIGCYPATYNTLPAYFLYYMWPLVIGSASFVYSCLTLRSFWNRRAQFSEIMSSNKALSPSRYFRLMLLALVDIMFTIPVGGYVLYVAGRGEMQPWISWNDTHFDFGHVRLFPSTFWRENHELVIGLQLTRWLSVFSAIVFFALFGFATEARRNYRLVFLSIAKRFGYTPSVKAASPKALPRYVCSLPVCSRCLICFLS